MKNLLLVLISFLIVTTSYGQFISKNDYTGSWSDDNSWEGRRGAPDTNLTGKEDVTIYGYITLSSDLTVKTTLTINDTLYIIGNLTVSGGGEVVNNGVLIVTGNYEGDGGSELNNSGVVFVQEDFNTGGGSSLNDPNNTTYVGGNSSETNTRTSEDFSSEQTELSNEFAAPLPVELLTFKGYATGNNIQLEWITAMEENFDFFTIERAGADREFKAIGTLKGQGNSTAEVDYSFTDAAPLPGQALYRLKATDIDGTVEYHRIISVYFDGKGVSDVNVYPNPVSQNNFVVNTQQADVQSIQLIDLAGRSILSQAANPGENQVSLPRNVQPGAYLLILKTSAGHQHQQRILVL